MAIIKLTAPIAGIRGSIAGITYTANKAGNYAKSWAKPPKSRTQNQSYQRALLSLAPQVWRDTLDSDDRDDWDTYAALPAQARTNSLGETYYCSGFNWFVIINLARIRAGQALSTSPPAGTTPATPTLTTFIAETGDVDDSAITYPEDEWDGYYMVLHVAQYRSTGLLQKTSSYFEVLVDTSPGSTEQDFQSEMEAVFGALRVGSRFFIRAFRQSTEGRRSAPATMAADVTQ
jgi:hypothetical protein